MSAKLQQIPLFYPLTDEEITRIKKGFRTEKHYHLREQGIPTLLVVVARRRYKPQEFTQLMKKGISVTSIALGDESIGVIESGECVIAHYRQFNVVLTRAENIRELMNKRRLG